MARTAPRSTALGILAADTALDQGLSLSDPVDVGAGATPEGFAGAVERVLEREDVDALVIVYVPPVAVPSTAYARALREVVAGCDIPGRLDVPRRGGGAHPVS